MMGKVHKLSPENYIRTKARTLPIYKCLVTPNWQDMGMASVIVMRKHVNGNCTVGLYLVDLMCLGIKDTYYMFNEVEDEVSERFNIGTGFFIETDYMTVHNIVYAGHDFAAEFDIKPHKDFEITRYILEEDNDNIPLIDVPVGEDGKPHLIVDSSYNYEPVLQKLKKSVGEGNYNFTISENDFDEDDDDYEDQDDEADFDEDDDDIGDDFDDTEQLTDFHTLKDKDTEELMEELEDGVLLMTTESLYRSELLWRKLKEEKPLSVLTDEKLGQSPEMIAFMQSKSEWEFENKASQEILGKAFEAIQEINYKGWDEDKKLDHFLKLMKKYRRNNAACVMIVNSISAVTIISSFPEIVEALKDFSPGVQLFLAAWDTLRKDNDPELSRIRQAATLQEAFPGNTSLHAYHIKCFWVLKALEALTAKDVKNIIYYHALVRTTGAGGHLKYFYASLLNQWLCELLNIDEDDILFQPKE